MFRLLSVSFLLGLCAGPAAAQASLADRIDDLRRETSVRIAVAEDPELRGADVMVDAADGVVVLSGLVPTLGARDRAVSLVTELPGVLHVRSTLRLQGNPTESIPDLTSVRREEDPEDLRIRQAESETLEPSPAEDGPVFHTVGRGDTLFGIARRYETTIAAISQLNNLGSTTVRLGQRLRVE